MAPEGAGIPVLTREAAPSTRYTTVALLGLVGLSVGVADGGPGLPVINWSTRGGDLRIAHFFGLHALQVLPLVGHLLSLPGAARRTGRPVYWVWAAGVAYGGLALLLFLQAMSGRPLLSAGT